MMTQRKSARTSLRQPREVEIDAHVGSRILERRELLGLSKADLASRLGAIFQQLYKFATGANRIISAPTSSIRASSFYSSGCRPPAPGRRVARRPTTIQLSADGPVSHGAHLSLVTRIRSSTHCCHPGLDPLLSGLILTRGL